MAGQPRMRALRVRLAEVARAAGVTSAEAWLFARIADGELLSTVCSELGCNRSLLYAWIGRNDARREAFRQARALAPDSHADEAVSIVDAATPDTIGVARARAEYRRFPAQSFNREQYGINAPPAAPALSVGQLHLMALQMSPEELRRLVEGPGAVTPASPSSVPERSLKPPSDAPAEHGTEGAGRGTTRWSGRSGGPNDGRGDTVPT